MPRGITQDQVNAAADALVAAGDKPTVEKVRAALGTGSPNTVTRMLDAWRSGLAERLQNVLQLPELPAEAGQAMMALWQLAVAQADRVLQARMTEDRAALAANEARLAEERTHWTTTLAEAETAVAQARTRQELAEHACTNLDSQLRDSHALREDLIQQRERLQSLADRQSADLQSLRAQLDKQQATYQAERIRLEAYVRDIEDRVHQETDRVRQEAKQWRQRAEAAERARQEADVAHHVQHATVLEKLRKVEREAAGYSGQVVILEKALSQALSRTTRKSRSTAAAGKALKRGARKKDEL